MAGAKKHYALRIKHSGKVLLDHEAYKEVLKISRNCLTLETELRRHLISNTLDGFKSWRKKLLFLWDNVLRPHYGTGTKPLVLTEYRVYPGEKNNEFVKLAKNYRQPTLSRIAKEARQEIPVPAAPNNDTRKVDTVSSTFLFPFQKPKQIANPPKKSNVNRTVVFRMNHIEDGWPTNNANLRENPRPVDPNEWLVNHQVVADQPPTQGG